jgi:hypothetical protein
MWTDGCNLPCVLSFYINLFNEFINIVTWSLKAGILEPEQTFVARQRLGKHIPAETNTHATIKDPVSKQRIGKHTIGVLLDTISIRHVQSGFKKDFSWEEIVIPCGGGVEYRHRSSASRRRRRKGKSRIWDSKIWSRVLRDSDPRMTALARTSSNCKR